MVGENQTQDMLQVTEPSLAQGEETPATPRTYSEEEYDKLLNEKKAADGRLKPMETQLSDLRQTVEKLQGEIDFRDEALLDKNNPEAKTAFVLKTEKRELQKQLNDALNKLTEYEDKARKYDGLVAQQGERKEAQDLANKYEGITAEELMEFAPGSKEKKLAYCKRHGKPRQGNQVPELNTTSGDTTSKKSPSDKIISGLKNL